MSLLRNLFNSISNDLTNPVNSQSGNNIEILSADVPEITRVEKEFIKTNLVNISKGPNSSYSVEIIAKKICSTLGKFDKTTNSVIEPIDPSRNSGFAAEFFLICILLDNGFEQHFCYRNLEENSPKKGFDGLYLKNDEKWIVESKSTHTSDTHTTTIKRAYNSISNQLEGKTNNNPWENAASHARSSRNNQSLVHELEELSEKYMDGKYESLSNCNLIIGSTVIDQNISGPPSDIQRIIELVRLHKTCNEKIVTVNRDNQQIFIDLMEEIANGQ